MGKHLKGASVFNTVDGAPLCSAINRSGTSCRGVCPSILVMQPPRIGFAITTEARQAHHRAYCRRARWRLAAWRPRQNGLWMSQIGRNVTDAVDGILTGKRYLTHDRDPLFTAEFLSLLANVGVQWVKLPPQSPNLNAVAERFVRSIKESCLDRLILFGEAGLRKAIRNFILH